MSEYGYIPESPAQSWGSNKGIFTPNDIYDLTRSDKYTQYGQLELIQTQSVSSAVCDFTSLGDYDIHFFTFQDVEVTTQTEFGYRLSDDGGTSFETGYQFANQRGFADGSFAERKSEAQDSVRLAGDLTTDSSSRCTGYLYLYNALDSTKYTFGTMHCSFTYNPTAGFEYGSSVYATNSSINGIRFGEGTTVSAVTSATISAYGIKAY